MRLRSKFWAIMLIKNVSNFEPNTRKYPTWGLLPVRSSYAVLPRSLWRCSQFVAWQVVSTTSAQKCFGVLYSSSIVLAISMSVRFFLSTTPFCWGVYVAENSCEIPSSSRKVSTFAFLNFVQLSLRTFLIFTSNWFWAFLAKFLKIFWTCNLSSRKNTHVNPENRQL